VVGARRRVDAPESPTDEQPSAAAAASQGTRSDKRREHRRDAHGVRQHRHQLFAIGAEALDPRGAEVVSLRFFSGLSVPEVAEHMGVSARTVESDWTHARAWLKRELAGQESS